MNLRSLFHLGAALATTGAALAATPPNLLVVYAEDISTELGCYGFAPVHTPNLDRLAAGGERFTHAFTTTPICSTSRTAMFTGVYPSRIGAQNHRTRPGIELPAPIRPLSHLFRDAGYQTLNFSGGRRRDNPDFVNSGAAGSGKTDLNFRAEGALFDNARGSLAEVPADQPWIGWLTLQESHKGVGWTLARERLEKLVNPNDIDLPPYWPDHPVARDEFANYLDAVSLMDLYFGEVWASLEATGQADRTIIVFLGDNGRCLFRDKQFLYEKGIHVPLIIRRPDGQRAGVVNDAFVAGIDVPALLLGLAGLPVPEWMDGRDPLAADAVPRDHIIALRDRADVALERMRAVRDRRFKYIRNFLPAVPYMQWNPYKEREYPTWNLIKELQAKGRLTPAQALFAAPHKPLEELYDLETDPYEIHNLALDPAYREHLERLRGQLDTWLAAGPDHGATMEDPLQAFRNYIGDDRTPIDVGQFHPTSRD